MTLEQDYSRDKGNGGTSDFTAHTTMLQAETPLTDGRSFVRVDHVQVSAGTFSTTDGSHSEQFGSCNDANAGAAGAISPSGTKAPRWASAGTTIAGQPISAPRRSVSPSLTGSAA